MELRSQSLSCTTYRLVEGVRRVGSRPGDTGRLSRRRRRRSGQTQQGCRNEHEQMHIVVSRCTRSNRARTGPSYLYSYGVLLRSNRQLTIIYVWHYQELRLIPAGNGRELLQDDLQFRVRCARGTTDNHRITGPLNLQWRNFRIVSHSQGDIGPSQRWYS